MKIIRVVGMGKTIVPTVKGVLLVSVAASDYRLRQRRAIACAASAAAFGIMKGKGATKMMLETLSLLVRVILISTVVLATVYFRGTLTALANMDRAVAGAFESVGR